MCPSDVVIHQRPETSSRPSTSSSDTMKPAFEVLDTDSDGRISLDDLRTFYAGYCGANAATEEDMGSMISLADSNKDGFVEFDEFERVLASCCCCNQLHQPPPASAAGNGFIIMEDVFKVMDRDGDGKLGFHDLKSYMSWAGFSASDDDIRAMIKLGGGDDADGVCFDGLLKILAVDLSCA